MSLHIHSGSRTWLLAPLVAAALTACSHADPFANGKPVDNPPFTSTDPQRLTYNIGRDGWPIWSADGNSIWYSVQDSLSHDKDHCLASIPAIGGTFAYRQCPTALENNFTEVLQQPAILDNVLAFALADLGTFPPEHVQYRFAIWIAGLATNAPPRVVMRFPYNAPSGKAHDGPIDLRWVRPGLLAYIGFEAGCCNKDSQRFGEQIVLLDVSGATPVRTFVPDTYRANALGASADGQSLYFTFYGDHRVYRRTIATGDVTVLHDFGAGHIVRDPDIVGDRMVATIDGLPNFQDLPPFDSVAIDHGGFLVLVNLTTGEENRIAGDERLYKKPRLSPDGRRLAAEGYPVTFTSTDTIVSGSSDLWIFEE
jgi:hypothetical protein